MENILSARLSINDNRQNDENEQEGLVRRGEMTPFGTFAEATSLVSFYYILLLMPLFCSSLLYFVRV
jgi:hypothetical protein